MTRTGLGERRFTRRSMLKGAGIATGLGAAGAIAATRSRARAATPGKVIVRTPGGAEQEAMRKAVFEPFTAATGIAVVSFATNASKILAMVEANNVQLDVADLGEIPTVQLAKRGALEKLDHAKFKHTNFGDLLSVHDYYLGEYVYGTVLGYNTTALGSNHPKNWAEFWDVKRFPGGRMLENIGAEMPNLEFALLADGVSLAELYPIDIPRAFNKLREIRSHITKWWDSGAVSAQMLANKQVVMGSVWNGRIQTLIDEQAPLAIEWNEAARTVQAFSILKGAPNLENAYALVDFAMQPKPQADFAKIIGYGPNNKEAFQFIDARMAARLPTSPEHLKVSYATNARWWVDHYAEVSTKWQAFLLGA